MSNKKICLLIASMFAFHCSFSQVKWQLKGGINYSNITAEDRDGDKAHTNAVAGLYLGLGAKVRIADHFFLNPSLVCARRGFRLDGVSDVLWWGKDLKTRASYIELPVDLLYSPKAGPGDLLIAVGPYTGHGIGGKWKTSSPVVIGDIVTSDKGDIDFQNDASYRKDRSFVYAKPWDYGVHFKIGYALFSRYSLSFEMQQGIANLEPRLGDYTPEGTIKNKARGLVLGYTF